MCFFFFNDTATTEIYTLSLHDALPISRHQHDAVAQLGDVRELLGEAQGFQRRYLGRDDAHHDGVRSEEHTSELQSRQYLVCRLLLEKKKKTVNYAMSYRFHR